MTESKEEIFKELIHNLPVCIDAMDAQGNIVFWNKECERVTGYRADEIIGNPQWKELLYPDAAYRGTLLNQWAQKGNNFRNWEIQLQAKDGTAKIISWTNLADVFTIPGWHTWAIGFDVTKYFEKESRLVLKEKYLQTLFQIRKDLQKAQTSEQIANAVLGHLEKLFQANGGLVLLYDFDHERAEVVAARFEQALFYRAENHIPLDRLIHLTEVKQGKLMIIEDLNTYTKSVKLASLLIKKMGMKTALLVPLMSENTASGSLSLYSKDKFQLKREDEAFLLHVGRLLAFSLHQSRLIEQFQNKIVRLEQQTISQVSELKRNERRLRAQYESIPIPTYTWQKNGDDFILIDYNDMALAATYGKIGGLLGQKASEIYRSLPELTDLLQECYENEITIETQIKSTSLSQEQPSYLSIKLAYVAPDSVLMHIEDITREFTAQQTIERLEKTIQRQDNIIRLMQNDLSIIPALFFPLLKDYLKKTDHFKAKIARELSGGKSQIVALTHDMNKYHQELERILNFLQSYLSLHNVSVKKEAINFTDFIQVLMDAHANDLKDFQTHFYLEAQEVFTDAALLHELLNLLITLIANHKPADRQPILRIISSKDEEKNFIITMKDNGRGVSGSTLDALDEVPTQNPLPVDDDFLSLLTIRRMVQLLFGKLKIKSEKDEGTTIEIFLPNNASNIQADDA